VGRLVRTPRKGSVIIIEFSDGMHEYVTTPVRRVLKIVGKDIFYIETANSRYRLEVRGKVRELEGASSGLVSWWHPLYGRTRRAWTPTVRGARAPFGLAHRHPSS
jgi:hypothetical protein